MIERRLKGWIEKYGKSTYSSENLDIAAAAIAEEDRQAERQEKRATDIDQFLLKLPNFARDDFNIDRIQQFFAQNPSATITDFENEILTNSDRYHWLAIVERKLTPQEEFARIEANFKKGVQQRKALDSYKGPTAAEQAAQAAAELRTMHSDPEQIARAKSEAEFIASSYQTGSHSDNARGRKLLRELVVYKAGTNEIDWFATKTARELWVKNPVGVG